jgi:hypothetical protein
MANNDSTTNNTESNVLKLQSLQSEFKLVMTQYQQAYANYISSLRSSSDPTSKKKFVVIPDSTFWGTTSLSAGTSSPSAEDCTALCSANSSCTGAIYISDLQRCGLRGGQSDIGPGLDTDSAIVSELVQNTQVLKMLNQKLLDINKNMEDTLGSMSSSENHDIADKDLKKGELTSIYNSLMEERRNINKMIDDSTSIEQSYNDNSIYVSQNNTTYTFWTLVALIIVVFTLKMQFYPELQLNMVSVVYWMIITILFITLMMQLNTPTGYLVWLALIAMVILQQMNMLPRI